MDNTSTQGILTIDIGGSHIKATVLDVSGKQVAEYQRLDTPSPATPENVLALITGLVKDLKDYNKISVGFPGYVKNGIVQTAPNLGTESWKNFDLQTKICELLGKPAKVVNDADLQGVGIVSGKGLEMMITLGTGFGTALLLDGKLLPHLELAHHPVKSDKTYDQYIGDAAYEDKGKDKWNERLQKIIQILKTVFNYDRLYISGGNAKNITFKLDDNIAVVSNKEGIKGGANLWRE